MARNAAGVALGSSPSTRGAHLPSPIAAVSGRLIPVYAGSTPTGQGSPVHLQAHPRLRGEHTVATVPPISIIGSSPSTRGAREGIATLTVRARLIPVYAGSTAVLGPADTPCPAHPRLRGEHTKTFWSSHASDGSSPSTRGAPPAPPPPLYQGRLIPVYAGSTRPQSRHGRPASAHPRLRGEHVLALWGLLVRFGSSPSTRGALVGSRRCPGHIRLIPVYAGSTSRL